MKISKLVPGSFGANCYVICEGGAAVVIDPSADIGEINAALKAADAGLEAIILTHGHFDHMLTLDRLRTENPQAPVCIHADDAELMPDGEKNAYMQFFGKNRDFGAPDKLLINGDTVHFGSEKLHVIHTPGHTKGSVCFRLGTSQILFTGDTVMSNGYGRCDLYSGNQQKMSLSLSHLKEMSEKENFIICPGHGVNTKLSDAIKSIYS